MEFTGSVKTINTIHLCVIVIIWPAVVPYVSIDLYIFEDETMLCICASPQTLNHED